MNGRTRIIATLVLGLAVALAAIGASYARADSFIPGYTDFPNALRVADEQRSEFIPGYTDFPNWLRYAPPGTIDVPAPTPVSSSAAGPGFDWADASIGAGVTAAAAILLVGGLSITLRRRGRLAASS